MITPRCIARSRGPSSDNFMRQSCELLYVNRVRNNKLQVFYHDLIRGIIRDTIYYIQLISEHCCLTRDVQEKCHYLFGVFWQPHAAYNIVAYSMYSALNM